MKKYFFVAMALVCAYATCFAQSKIPTAVITAFQQKFPNAAQIKWEKENDHIYEAAFEYMSEHLSSNFSEAGAWLETERPLFFNQLPENVQQAFRDAHKGAILKEVAKIERADGSFLFEVEFKKGLKSIEVLYTPEGKETTH
jgi:hypothetical protein